MKKGVGGAKFKFIKENIEKNLNERVVDITHVQHEEVYRVKTERNILRIDLNTKFLQKIQEQTIAFENGINIPRVLYYSTKLVFKISEWIVGVSYPNIVTNFEKDDFIVKFGEQFSQLNCIKRDNLFLTIGDPKKSNFIFSDNNQVYFIDTKYLNFTLSVIPSIVRLATHPKGFIKGSKNKKLFLEGYSKYGNVQEVSEHLFQEKI